MAVATTAIFTTRTTGTVGVILAWLGRLLDTLVGKAITDIGLTIVSVAATTIGAVLALIWWILANAVPANQTRGTIAFRGAFRISSLAAPIHTILTLRAGFGAAATFFT